MIKSLFVIMAILLAGTVYGAWVVLRKHRAGERLEELVGFEEPAMLTERLVGEPGRALSPITEDSGQVEIHGELWEARLAEPMQSLANGAAVRVIGLRGTCLLVSAI